MAVKEEDVKPGTPLWFMNYKAVYVGHHHTKFHIVRMEDGVDKGKNVVGTLSAMNLR